MALDLSFKDLADVAAGGCKMDGRPLLIPLAHIDEDRDQPRRVFNDDELVQLADSIQLVGILQPIIVRPSEVSGRYVISMGARRCRAARLAGLDAVPAIVQEASAPDRYAQIIENIQRDDLAAAEIAAFIVARLEGGEKQADIARKMGKPRDWVSRFAAIPKMPGFLQAKLHTSSVRAVYELYQAWRVQPEIIEQACSIQESFTDAQARHIAHDLRASSLTPTRNAPGDDLRAAPAAVGENPRPKAAPLAQSEHDGASAHVSGLPKQRKSKPAVSIVVRHGNRAGRLLIERPASNGSRFGVVLFFETGQIDELPVSDLRLEEIAPC